MLLSCFAGTLGLGDTELQCNADDIVLLCMHNENNVGFAY